MRRPLVALPFSTPAEQTQPDHPGDEEREGPRERISNYLDESICTCNISTVVEFEAASTTVLAPPGPPIWPDETSWWTKNETAPASRSDVALFEFEPLIWIARAEPKALPFAAAFPFPLGT